MKYILKDINDNTYKTIISFWNINPNNVNIKIFSSQEQANNSILEHEGYYIIIITLEEAIKEYEVSH